VLAGDNLFGKICTRCGYYMPPRQELSIVKENRLKKALLLQEAMKLIARKRGSNDANNH
jgi:hypothetical protein